MAYDLTVHSKSIKRNALKQLDFATYPNLKKPEILDRLINKCEAITFDGFKNMKLSQTVLFGKNVYKIKSFEHELALRLIAKNLRKLTGIRQTNRNSIILSLKTLFQDGGDYKVFKFDIKSFYENVDIDSVLTKLENDRGFSRSHLVLLKDFFKVLSKQSINGLPRGLAISATLAEYILRDFDTAITQKNTVFFNQRFVDDIIIVAHPDEELKGLIKFLRKNLPHGLELNAKKTRALEFVEPVLKKAETCTIHGNVDFLGYTFKVHQRQKNRANNAVRLVQVDISKSKTNKIKTKIIRSCMSFCKTGNYLQLENRIKLLSGNYTIYDHGRRVRRKAGIYFNYCVVDSDASNSLVELDDFLKKLLLSTNGKLCAKLSVSLSSNQRRKLLKFSFSNGFKKRVFYNFSGKQIVELMECWSYV